MKYCKLCKKPLLNIAGKFYLHPFNSCDENDGYEIREIDKYGNYEIIMVSDFLSEKFKERYGNPKETSEEEIIKLESELEKIKNSPLKRITFFLKTKFYNATRNFKNFQKKPK